MIKHIYLIQSLENGYFKIGISKNPSKRIEQLQTGNPSKLKLIETYKSAHANIVEKAIQRRYEHLRKEGEWFCLSIKEEVSFHKECEKIEKSIVFLKKSNNVFI